MQGYQTTTTDFPSSTPIISCDKGMNADNREVANSSQDLGSSVSHWNSGQSVNGGVKTSQVAAQKSATVDMACLSAV